MRKSLGTILQENIKLLMEASGSTQTEVAKKGQFSQGGLSELLSNDMFYPNPTLDFVERLADGFGVPATWLLTDHKKPSQRIKAFPSHDFVCVMVPEIEALVLRMKNQERDTNQRFYDYLSSYYKR